MQHYEKLKQNYEFRRAYNRGKSFVTPFFVLYAVKTKRQQIRLGITAGKKLGGAVQRNRAKRLLRAAFAGCLSQMPVGYDFVLVARSRILQVKSTQVQALLWEQLCVAGVLTENEKSGR